MSIKSESQLLEQDALIELYEWDLSEVGLFTLYMHSYDTDSLINEVVFGGQAYTQYPVRLTGISTGTDGALARPTLSVGDTLGLISAFIKSNDDLLGTKFTVRRTYRKYLDDGSNPDPTAEFPQETFYLERKTVQNKKLIEWELAVQFDVDDVKLPRRKVLPNLCPWVYRSANCGYTGGPVADNRDQPTNDSNLDECSKRISGCKLRFGSNGELPFGGFPAAGRF